MSPLPISPDAVIADLAKRERGRLLAALIHNVSDFQLAEDCLQEAMISASGHWSKSGIPSSPVGWLLKVARRKAIDHIRRAQNFSRKAEEYGHLVALEQEHPEPLEDDEIPDERLRLIFTCCHPAIDRKNRIALTLRTLGGLTTGEIARAFLVSEETMAQRLVRAKAKIKKAGIGYRIPEPHELPDRLSSVLLVVYLIFNEGYSASGGEHPLRQNLTDEAIRLGRLVNQLQPDEPEIMGLLALMLLHDSRKPARILPSGAIATLDIQDRSLWDDDKRREGTAIVEKALSLGRPGAFQIEAAISALHSQAPSTQETDWAQIALLYDELAKYRPDEVVTLNKAVAISFAQSPETALAMLDKLEKPLGSYRPFHAAKADFLRRAGRPGEAAKHYRRAIALPGQREETRFLQERLDRLSV